MRPWRGEHVLACCCHITWLLSHHMVAVTSHGCCHITWLLSHHMVAVTSHGKNCGCQCAQTLPQYHSMITSAAWALLIDGHCGHRLEYATTSNLYVLLTAVDPSTLQCRVCLCYAAHAVAHHLQQMQLPVNIPTHHQCTLPPCLPTQVRPSVPGYARGPCRWHGLLEHRHRHNCGWPGD
jgi:hypothetical protein